MALWITLVIVFFPGLYFWKSAAWVYTNFLVPQMGVCCFFLAQSIFRSEVDEIITYRDRSRVYYWKTSDRAMTLVMWLTILGALFSATYFGLLLWGVIRCYGYTVTNLVMLIFGVSCDDPVDLTTLNRLPYFANELGFAELCLDSFPISVFVLTVTAAIVVLDVGCAFYQWRLKFWSEDIHRAYAMNDAVIEIAAQGGGDQGAVDALLDHIKRETEGALYIVGPTNPAFEARMKKER